MLASVFLALSMEIPAHDVGHAPVLLLKSELNVNRLSVEHSVNLLVCPAEHLLVEVPEINYEQNADYRAKQLNGLFAEIAH